MSNRAKIRTKGGEKMKKKKTKVEVKNQEVQGEQPEGGEQMTAEVSLAVEGQVEATPEVSETPKTEALVVDEVQEVVEEPVVDSTKALLNRIAELSEKVQALETVSQVVTVDGAQVKVDPAAKSNGNGAQRFGAAHISKAVMDTVTGITYTSLYKAGLAFQSEFPLTNKKYLWYKALAKHGEGAGKRFQIVVS